MSDAFQFKVFVQGKPVSWARARVSRHGGMFTPPKQRAYKLMVAQALSSAVRRASSAPLVVVIRVQILRPRTNKTLLPATRNTSDADNWAKMILDAGNGVAWKDDAQVVALEVSKIWVSSAKEEGVMIQCAEIDPEEAIELWDGESPLN